MIRLFYFAVVLLVPYGTGLADPVSSRWFRGILNPDAFVGRYVSEIFRLRPKATRNVDSGLPTIAQLDNDVDAIVPVLERMNSRTFFRIFKVDLTRDCPFWAAEAMCSHPDGGCSVCECDRDQIPKKWIMKPIDYFVERKEVEDDPTDSRLTSSEEVGISLWDKPETFFSSTPLNVAEDALHRSNSITNSASRNAVYVDLRLNKPGYTAYKGAAVWRQIYNENCMGRESDSNNPLYEISPGILNDEPTCREEQRFYRILSGMHSNIAALSSEYYAVGDADLASVKQLQSDGDSHLVSLMEKRLLPNADFFVDKLALYPNRIENLYLTFSVLMRTLCKLAPIIEECTCDTGSHKEDLPARADLFFLLNQTYASCEDHILDAPLFENKQPHVLRQFHNISRILDCIECQKCRLHGKLKMTALQLALRASGTGHIETLERNEVTALVNALYYFAHSIQIVRRMEERLALRVLEPISYCVAALIGIAAVLRLKKALFWSRKLGNQTCNKKDD